ncbi:MAG: protein kinase [Proteobacteria bacterium]|nr:protein kinase [Pseudomonadota bacterium]
MEATVESESKDKGNAKSKAKSAANLIGQTIVKQYRLISVLGTDFAGTLYNSEDVTSEDRNPAALKVLNQDFAVMSDAVLAIDHPNILKIRKVLPKEHGIDSILMEPPRGECARALLSTWGKIPPEQSISAALQMLSALHALHFKDILIGNLILDSIFFSRDELEDLEIKIVNVGIRNKQKIPDKPFYLAPEQVLGGDEGDRRVDIWAVGAILFEMLFGRRPFFGRSQDEIVGKILLRDPPFPDNLGEVPEEIVPIIRKALQKEPEDRYQNATTMVGDLLLLQEELDESMSKAAATALKESFPPRPSHAQADGKSEPVEKTAQNKEPEEVTGQAKPSLDNQDHRTQPAQTAPSDEAGTSEKPPLQNKTLLGMMPAVPRFDFPIDKEVSESQKIPTDSGTSSDEESGEAKEADAPISISSIPELDYQDLEILELDDQQPDQSDKDATPSIKEIQANKEQKLKEDLEPKSEEVASQPNMLAVLGDAPQKEVSGISANKPPVASIGAEDSIPPLGLVDSQGAEKRNFNSTFLIIGGVVAALCVVAISAFLFIKNSEKPATSPQEQASIIPESVSIPEKAPHPTPASQPEPEPAQPIEPEPKPDPEPAQKTEPEPEIVQPSEPEPEPEIVQPSEPEPEPEPEIVQPSEPEPEPEPEQPGSVVMVTITLIGLPAGARVTVDEEEVTSPIVLPQSKKPVRIKAYAEGRRPFKERIIPDRDRKFDVLMKKIKSSRSHTKPKQETD